MSVFSTHPPSFLAADYPAPPNMFDSYTSTTSTTTTGTAAPGMGMGASFQIINPNPALASLPARSRHSTSPPPHSATSSKRSSLHHSASAPAPAHASGVTRFVSASADKKDGGKEKGRESGRSAREERASREFELELEREVARRAGKGEVWNAMLATAKGRDKSFKVVQYALKVYLLSHQRSFGALLSKGRSDSLLSNLNSTVSSLSLYRKVTIMFAWLSPLTQILHPPSLPFPVTLSISTTPFASPPPPSKPLPPSILQRLLRAPPPVLLSLLQSLSDDVRTLSLLRVLPARLGHRADRLATWCWFFSSLAQLVENGAERGIVRQLVKEVQEKIYEGELEGRDLAAEGCADVEEGERELERLRGQLAWIDRMRWKLVMDLIYVSYDLFKIKRGREPVMAATGLIAGALSTAKLYEQHKQALIKSAADV